ncbi:MAG: hypothetical protein Fur0024_5010 [Patescibacteria group bacterium]
MARRFFSFRKKNFKKLIILLSFLFLFANFNSSILAGNSTYVGTDEPLENGSSSGVEVDSGINSGGERMTLGIYTMIGSISNGFDGFMGDNGLGEPIIKSGLQTYDQLTPKVLAGGSVKDRNDLTSGTDESYAENPTALFADWSNVFYDDESGIRNFRYDISLTPDGNDLPANKTLWRKSTADNSTFLGSVSNAEFGSNFIPGTTYYFCVVAVNNAGFSGEPICSNGITFGSIEIIISASKESSGCILELNDCEYNFGTLEILNSPFDTQISTFRGAKININVTPDNLNWKLNTKISNQNFSNGSSSIEALSRFKYKLSLNNDYENFSTNWTPVATGNGDAEIFVDYQLILNLFDSVGTNFTNSVEYQGELVI